MASPMFEIPEHLPIPVDKNGDGPADPASTVAWACWCGLGLWGQHPEDVQPPHQTEDH